MAEATLSGRRRGRKARVWLVRHPGRREGSFRRLKIPRCARDDGVAVGGSTLQTARRALWGTLDALGSGLRNGIFRRRAVGEICRFAGLTPTRQRDANGFSVIPSAARDLVAAERSLACARDDSIAGGAGLARQPVGLPRGNPPPRLADGRAAPAPRRQAPGCGAGSPVGSAALAPASLVGTEARRPLPAGDALGSGLQNGIFRRRAGGKICRFAGLTPTAFLLFPSPPSAGEKVPEGRMRGFVFASARRVRHDDDRAWPRRRAPHPALRATFSPADGGEGSTCRTSPWSLWGQALAAPVWLVSPLVCLAAILRRG